MRQFYKWRLAILALMGVSMSSWSQQPPNVHLKSGRIAGKLVDGVEQFLGIPYARPPVGKLRWQRPLSVHSWQGTKQTTEFGPSCMQNPVKEDSTPVPPKFSEDCLTANVWRPHQHQGKLPVMVWIHGGGFTNGGSASPVYNGQQFAKQGVIFISFNYRLGRLGFFAHPSLTNNMFHGNYGLMDQIKLLRWVQDNIMFFGGDPNNITVVGESAGGYSIHALLTGNYSRNLFNKAIIESGGGRFNLNRNLSWAMAEQQGVNFAKQHGITGDGEKALKKLRQLSPKAVTGKVNMFNMGYYRSTYSGPMNDGHIIARNPQRSYKSGNFSHVPLLVGANTADLGFVRHPLKSRDQVFKLWFDQLASQARQAYKNVKSVNDLQQLIARQMIMIEPARFVAQQWEKQDVPVWEYRFSYVANTKEKQWPGAIHASEIPYVFNTLSASYGSQVTQRDQKMAHLMHKYWTNFAKTGNPNGENLPKWSQYQAKKDNLMWFSPKGADHSRNRQDPQHQQLQLIQASY